MSTGSDEQAESETAPDGPKIIEGSAQDVTPTALKTYGLPLGLGLLGGVAGAALVGVAYMNLVPQGDAALRAQVEALQVKTVETEELLLARTGGFFSRMSAVEEKVRQHTDQIGPGPVANRLDALQGLAEQTQHEIDRLDTSLAAFDQDSLTAELEELKSALALLALKAEALDEAKMPEGLPEQVRELSEGMSSAALQIGSLGSRLDRLDEIIAAPDPTAEAALGIALANLTRAVEAGTPFVAELEAIAALAPDDDAIAGLRAAASAGVESFAALDADFANLVQPLLTAERQAGREGYWDRFVGNVMSIVTVRRTGDVAGDDVEAIVARIETLLAREDLAAAAAEAEKLAGPAADVIAPWLQKVSARLATDEMVRSLSARVLVLVTQGGE